MTRTQRTLVNIVLTGFPFQACLTLTLVVVDEIVAVGLGSLARIALTIIDVDLTEFPLEAQGAATSEVILEVETGPVVVTVNILALTQPVTELKLLKIYFHLMIVSRQILISTVTTEVPCLV